MLVAGHARCNPVPTPPERQRPSVGTRVVAPRRRRLNGDPRRLPGSIRALCKRRARQRRIHRSALDRCSLQAALEAIPTPAFLVTAGGVVRYANTMGAEVLERERATLRAAASDDLGELSTRFQVTKIASPGSPDQYLAVMRAPFADPAPRLSKAAALWGLTPRQTDVLALLTRGCANKTIATRLACSRSTIEVHVTTLLEKTGCESRSELIARYWTAI